MRSDSAATPTPVTQAAPAATSVGTMAYEYTSTGALVGIEVVPAQAWEMRFLTPPPVERADARIVVLATHDAAVPVSLPAWLRVQSPAAGPPGTLRVHEQPPAYAASPGDTMRLADALWDGSPHHAPGIGTIEDCIAAAATAARFPAPVPTEVARCSRIVRDYARAHVGGVCSSFLGLEGSALLRALHRGFRDPDTLAAQLLIERIDRSGDAETADLLRFLRDAEVAETAPQHLELALDRRALLEQASPWRYFEGGGFAPALAAVRPWTRRYRAAYDAEYRRVAARAAEVRRTLDSAACTAHALRRIDAIETLGPPVGAVALHAFEAARAALDALPADPHATLARTAGVTLGASVPAFDAADRATEATRDAFEVQRPRLAARAAHLVLDRTEIPALDRLLQAITASDLDGIERVLDDRLATHIEELLSA